MGGGSRELSPDARFRRLTAVIPTGSNWLGTDVSSNADTRARPHGRPSRPRGLRDPSEAVPMRVFERTRTSHELGHHSHELGHHPARTQRIRATLGRRGRESAVRYASERGRHPNGTTCVTVPGTGAGFLLLPSILRDERGREVFGTTVPGQRQHHSHRRGPRIVVSLVAVPRAPAHSERHQLECGKAALSAVVCGASQQLRRVPALFRGGHRNSRRSLDPQRHEIAANAGDGRLQLRLLDTLLGERIAPRCPATPRAPPPAPGPGRPARRPAASAPPAPGARPLDRSASGGPGCTGGAAPAGGR
jgi:hypothetical protein